MGLTGTETGGRHPHQRVGHQRRRAGQRRTAHEDRHQYERDGSVAVTPALAGQPGGEHRDEDLVGGHHDHGEEAQRDPGGHEEGVGGPSGAESGGDGGVEHQAGGDRRSGGQGGEGRLADQAAPPARCDRRRSRHRR